MISKTKQLRKLLTLLLLVVAMAMPKVAWSQSDEGITPTEPALSDGFYQIGTARELMWFMQHVADGNTSACCELTDDIVLNTNLLQTIDAKNTPVNTWIMPSEYRGTFDGNGHTISGIYLPISRDEGAAMFKQLYGTIKELGVLDSYFGGSGTYHAATFTGYLKDNGSIIDCYSFAKIDGTYYNGGIAGDCNDSKSSITNCYFAGSMTSTNNTSSPISCDYYNKGTITNCYYLSTVVNKGMTVTRSTSVTEEKMKSGRVAYALRAGRDKSLWGQELTNDPKDNYPTLSNRTVYCTHLTCNGMPYDDAEFNNNPATEVTQDVHTYGDPSITPPTCTENGYRTRTCSTCGHEEITVIDATSHTDEDGDHICDICSVIIVPSTEPALSDGFYQIGTAGELMWFMQHVADGNTSACCKLTADIVLNTNLLQTIDAKNTPVNTWIMPSEYRGTFDGNGHTISGIYLPISRDEGAAMFKQLYGTIKELGVLDSYFGGIGTYYAATFAGKIYNNGIIDCYSFAKIDGTYYNGGIAGRCYYTTTSITNCYFAGSMTSNLSTSSPITCDYYDGGTITNCYYLSTVVNAGMTATRATSVTKEKEMKNGWVAFALRAGRDKNLWGQELTNDPKDNYPTLSNRTVYCTHLTCNGMPYDDAEFNNNPATEVTQDVHTYGEPSVTSPTCTENGSSTLTCSTCGHEEITALDAKGHTDTDGDHICDVCSGVISEQPTLVTMDNYVELGLSADYVGYRAIENMYHLYYFAECMNRQSTDWEDTGTEPTDVKFVLSKDIKVNERVLDENGRPLASLSNPIFWLPVNMSFKGATTPIILDGNNHHISGLVKRSNYHNGFIEEFEGNITIKNLGITDSYFYVIGDFLVVGSIAARLYNGKIENCWSDATIAASNDYGNAYAGGLVGGMDGGSIIKSSFSGLIITNNMQTAGIVSYVDADESEVMISKCRFSGTIQANGNDLTHGGITGNAYPEDFKVTIEKCIADGKVVINGYENNIAGIIGYYETGGSYAKVINNISSLTVEDEGEDTYKSGLFDCLDIYSKKDTIACNVNTNKNVEYAIRTIYIDDDVTPIISHNFSAGSADDDSNDEYTTCTDETFASGKVAYLLNEYNKSALGNNEPVWYQLIGEENYPTFEGDAYSVVYHSNELGYYNLPVEMDTYTLTDGEAYERTRRTLVHNFTYNRTFSESQAGKWQAMYIPFKLSYADWSPYFDVAAINNFHEYTDDNGEVKNVELEVRMVTKGSIKANSPCLIRPKTAGEVNIQLTEVTLESSKSNAISCSSVGTKYTFTGIYQPLSNLKTMGCIFLTRGELREAADDEQVLKAQRWYLTREDLGNYLEETTPVSPKMSTIKIRVIGDDATGIEDIQVVRSMSAAQQSREGIYDLQGRQLSAPAKGMSIIRQANGSTRKVVVK